MSVTDAAKKYLGMVREPKTVAEITEALNRGGLPCKLDSVMTIISRGGRAGDFAKIGSGHWGLPEFYKDRKENGDTA